MSQLSIIGTVDYVRAPDAEPDRDTYCTPPWLTAILPPATLDPCSNERSTVIAANTYRLDRGQDGLALPWFGLVYANIPFSDPMRWAVKLEQERARGELIGCAFMVNEAHDTRWWRRAVKQAGLVNRLDFDRRIPFVPPPGVVTSSNDRAQTLLMDDEYLSRCSSDLLCVGTLWRVQR